MAWISVDQKLIGGKLRKLYKAIGCSQNEAIGILVSLWLWGIDNADLDGLIVSAERSDIEDVLKTGLSPEIDSAAVVNELVNTGWIDDADGALYLHDWPDWRSYYNRYMNNKKSQAERMRRYRSKNTENNVTGDVYSDGTSDVSGEPGTVEQMGEPKKPKTKQEDKYGKEFEEFWSLYPKKADKGQAFKKYTARRKDGYSPEELRIAAENYRRQCERQHTDPQYIKHAKTFLGEALPFLDFIPKEQEVQSGNVNIGNPGTNPFRRNGG